MKSNLTQGPIIPTLIGLAVPAIGMSFVQMAYSMIDMMWLGRTGSVAVAAVGTAGFFIWFGQSVHTTTKMGAEIAVAQEIGKGDSAKAGLYAGNAIFIGLIMATIYGAMTWLLAPELIAFFDLAEPDVNEMAIAYLRVISISAPFYYLNPTLSGIFTGAGNTKLSFKVTAIGLLLNIIIDPLFIFGFGPIPALGATGAAIATVIAQLLVTSLFLLLIYQGRSVMPPSLKALRLDRQRVKRLLKLGVPVAANTALFTCFSIAIAKIVSQWGALPIAVQSIGAQIEALSWMTASGFATALGAFVGQNYGANQWDRIRKAFFTTIVMSVILGALVTLVLCLLGEEIFGLFIPEEEAIKLGGSYLLILAASQIFMCIEISTSGAFYGIGRSVPPSLISILFTGMRIPLALLLSGSLVGLGLFGVWWSVSLSSIFKGTLLFFWFNWILRASMKGSTQFKQSLAGP